MTMRRIIFAVCLLVIAAVIESRAFAAPPCWPADPTATRVYTVAPSVSAYRQMAAWQCADGTLHSMYFNWSEAAAYLQRYVAIGMTAAEADALYNTTADKRPASGTEAAFARSVFVTDFGLAPAVLAEGIAYKQRTSIDGAPTYLRIGKVAPGTACMPSGPAGGFMVVPRASVTLDSKLATLPPATYARCG
jgi:hypothetical protein